ncbi:MAG: alpha/beta fold hydrolase [Actinomycetota bacterium]|nr:alpha/beta fold hydrolase [Actinomycetota bacterium]
MPRTSTWRRWPRFGVAAGAGTGVAAGTAVAWALQHRVVARSTAEAARTAKGAFVVPGDLLHHFVDLDDGGVAHVVERGSGPPIVLVHGATLSSDLWCQQLTELGARHRMIAVDVRGHGRSTPGSDGFRGGMGRLAADLRQVFDALDVEGAVLAGHSLGGMISLQLAAEAPSGWRARHLHALALLDTSAGPLASWRGASRMRRPISGALARAMVVADRIGVGPARSADVRWWSARFAFGPDPDPAQVAFTESMGAPTPVATLAGVLGTLASFDITARLPDVDLLALVVVGSHDRLTPPSHARRLADGLPRAELVELPRAGHMPMLERPHELARLLDELAGKVAAGS